MCVTPESEFFWIGLALFLGVGFVCFRVARRFWRDASAARDAESWIAVFMDHAPALTINGLWLMILVFAGASCGIRI